MKIAAHPLVVAVALGLLGPASLEESEERLSLADSGTLRHHVDNAEPATADEIARIEAAYHEVTLNLS